MGKFLAACVLLTLTACGDDPATGESGATEGEAGSTADPTAAPTTAANDATTTTAPAPATGTGTDGDASTGNADDASDDGPAPAAAPVQLYRGPVAEAVVPGWDPDAPRPLLMMGRLGDAWIATLARIGDDGSLSDNVAEEIVVWGWDVEPPQLYDGAVGGTLAPWSADAPYPVVLLGYRDADGSWVTTLSSIDAAGTLGDNLADRLVVWGWSSPSPGAPSELYDGPVGGTLPGWDGGRPQPLVMLGRLPGTDTWQATLAGIAPDGTLGMNLAEQLLVWGW